MKFITLLSWILLVSLFFIPKKDIEGIYFQEGNSNVKLLFGSKKFAVIEQNYRGNGITSADTITFGTWSIESERMIAVSSDVSFESALMDVEVEELKDTLAKNKISIIIDNPIESIHKKYKYRERDVHYNIALSDVKENFLEKELILDHDTNYFQVNIPANFKMASFEIFARKNEAFGESEFAGKRNIGVSEVETARYFMNDSNTNSFRVKIPKLRREYFTYLRLNRDFIKIIDRNTLEWDGYIYRKKNRNPEVSSVPLAI